MPYTEDRGNWDSGYLSSKGDLDNRIRLVKTDRNYIFSDFGTDPDVGATAPESGAAVSSTTDRTVHSAHAAFRISPCGSTQTLLGPLKTGTGWNISHDTTDNDEIEMIPSGALQTDCPAIFTVGTDAAFFWRAKLTLADASGCELCQGGFRKQAAFAQKADTNPPVLSDYADYAAIGTRGTANPNTIKIATQAASGGETLTDTTQTWADTAVKTLAVKVSAAGVVTYENSAAAPTTVASYTFTNALVLIPFLALAHGTDVGEGTVINEWESGHQPSSRVTLV